MYTKLTDGKVPVINLKKTGKNIARMRKNAGISVRDLQVIFGFTNPQAIYSWQNGKCLPSVDNLLILSMILGVTIDEIISVEEDDPDSVDGRAGNTPELAEDFDGLAEDFDCMVEDIEGIRVYPHLVS